MASNADLIKALPPLPKNGDKDLLDLLAAMKRVLEVREGVGHSNTMDRNVTFADLQQYHNGSTFKKSFSEGPRGYQAAVPRPPTDLVVVVLGSTSRKLTWRWPLDSKQLDMVEVYISPTSSRSDAELIARVTWPVAEYARGGFPADVAYYFWIRVVRGGSYSPWEPPDAQGGYVVVPADVPTVNDLLNELTQMDRYSTSYTMVLDAFQIMQPSGAIPAWVAGSYNKDAKVKHTLPGPGYSYYQSTADGNVAEPPGVGWISIDAAVDNPLRTFTIGNIDGIPTVGVHGDMLVDHSLLTRHFSATDIYTVTIASSDYVPATAGWKIDATTGVAEFNNFQMVINYHDDIDNIPASLADINSAEWNKLNTGLESWVLGNFIDAVTFGSEIDALWAQIDGLFETWFYAGPPGPTVLPESGWLSPDTRSSHPGDLYLDKTTGAAYRYYFEDPDYVWRETDSATAEALALAQNAFDLADDKRRIFVVQPFPPYDAGDLWRKTAAEIWACVVGRVTGVYTASDWTLASTAGAPLGTTVGGVPVTTLVNQSLLGQAELLFADSFDAYADPPDLSSRWTVNIATSQISRVTGLAGVGYALRSLDDVGGLGLSIDKEIPLTPSVIFTARFKYQSIGGTQSAFYTGLPNLLNDAGQTTFALQVTGGWLRYRDSLGADINIVGCAVDVVHDLMLQVNCLAGEATVVLDGLIYGPYPLAAAATAIKTVRIRSYITNQEDYTLDDVAIYAGDISLAELVATAQATATSAVTAAGLANAALEEIADNNLLTPVEKPPIIQQHGVLVAEQAGIDAQADAFGVVVEKAAYDAAMTALLAYLATLTSPVLWSDTSGNTTIDRATFIADFNAAYAARQALLNAVSVAAKVLADAAQATGQAAQATANGKNTVFVQVAVPTATKINDQWIDLGSNNRVLHSDSLDNPYWLVNSGATIVPDAAENYAGEVTADKLQETAIDAYHYVSCPTFQYTAGKFYLHSVDVQAAGRNYVRLALVSGAFGTLKRVSFNLTTGVAGSITGTPEFYDSINMGNGWWRLFVGHTAVTTVATHGALVYSESSLGLASYLGDGASGVYLARTMVAELDALADAESHCLAQYIPTTDAMVDNTGYNRLHRWTGTVWEAIADTGILQAQLAAGVAQAAADAAQDTADDAMLAAEAAQLDADAANDLLTDIADDGLLKPIEKPDVVSRRDVLVAEQAGIDAQAVTYGLATEKAAYDTALADLVAYLATLTTPVPWWNLLDNTTVVRDTFLAKFNAVPLARQALLNAIYAAAKARADAAQDAADDAMLAADAAQDTANDAMLAAAAAQLDADAANDRLTDIADDGLLKPIEKPDVVSRRDVLVAEQAGIDAQAVTYGLVTEKAAYDTALADLVAYLATLTTPVPWWNLLDNTTIVRDTFLAKFNAVALARQALLNAIYAAAKARADAAALTALWVGVTGEGRPESGADVTANHTANDTNNVAGTPAAQVAANAAAAAAAVANMSADGYLSAQEKAQWRILWPGEDSYYSTVIDQATTYGLENNTVIDALVTSHTTLAAYLTTTLAVWSAPTADAAIEPSTRLADYVDDYYARLGDAINVLTSYATQAAVDNTIDTTTGGLIVRNSSSGDYGHFTGSGLTYFFNSGGTFYPYKAVKKVLPGTAANGVLFTIPGYWRTAPQIFPSMRRMPIYKSAYAAVDQDVEFSADTPSQVSAGVWQTRIYARLITSAGVTYLTWANEHASVAGVYGQTVYDTELTTTQATPVNVVSVTFRCNLAWEVQLSGNPAQSATVTVSVYCDNVAYPVYSASVGYNDWYAAYPGPIVRNLPLTKVVPVAAGSHNVYFKVVVSLYASSNYIGVYNVADLSDIKVDCNIGANSILATGDVNYLAYSED